MKKTILITFVLVFSGLILSAQSTQQNDNAHKSLKKYQKKLTDHEATMGETVQNTYKAIDPKQDKLDKRELDKERQKEFRRQLKLERARNDRRDWQNRQRDPWGRTYPRNF